ncbi:helix-turn-helix domain-containing protein [Flavobacteriaceae bacterium LMO-SS05]
MKVNYVVLFALLVSLSAKAQYSFSGQADKEQWQNNVYLSLIEDYRKLSGVFSEQIISKHKLDSLGYFQFYGNQLDAENRIYRIHVDNCNDADQNQNHFEGHCDDSKEVLFIAKNSDTINFPFTFDNQMFCRVMSSNEKANVFIRIDSVKEEMKYAYGEFRSEASRKLNNKKWFKTLQEFGASLHEPLAELYIYAFLSDRSNSFHEYYLEDLKSNPYYDKLLNQLTRNYPSSPYTKQYQNEIASDKYSIHPNQDIANQWLTYAALILLGFSIFINIVLFSKLYQKKKHVKTDLKSALTKQEQNILKLLLEDKSNKDIAEALFVSLSTVKTHVNNVYKKLNVQTRDDAKKLFNS